MSTTPRAELVLEGPGAEGLEAASECSFPPEPGLHVIVGKNNSGKSRLLRALSAARLRVTLAELSDPNEPRLARELKNTSQAFPMRIEMTREGVTTIGGPPLADTGQGPISLHLVHALQRAMQFRQNGSPAFDTERAIRKVLGDAWKLRPAWVVPTNRMMEEAALVEDIAPLPFNPDQWPPARWPALLEILKSDPTDATRGLFEKIRAEFSFVTEGLTFEVFGARTRTVYVIGAGERHALSQCGDGLRDILGILLYAVLAPAHDLFTEEPGIRLHPSAQKRLLEVLERESKKRAIWITSHDNPYVFARGVASRFVTKKVGKTIEIKRSATNADHLSCLKDLGWEPAMAVIADTVIYCEGPSDKIAFEAALREEDRRVVAFPLGGSSAVTDDAQWPKLMQRIDSVRELLPHVTQVVVLDSDGDPARLVKVFEQLKKRDIVAKALPRQMLESYWLNDEMAAIVAEMARAAAERSSVVMDAGLIPGAMSAHQAETHAKKRLRQTVDDVIPGAFSEERAAKTASAVAPLAMAELRKDLKALIW